MNVEWKKWIFVFGVGVIVTLLSAGSTPAFAGQSSASVPLNRSFDIPSDSVLLQVEGPAPTQTRWFLVTGRRAEESRHSALPVQTAGCSELCNFLGQLSFAPGSSFDPDFVPLTCNTVAPDTAPPEQYFCSRDTSSDSSFRLSKPDGAVPLRTDFYISELVRLSNPIALGSYSTKNGDLHVVLISTAHIRELEGGSEFWLRVVQVTVVLPQ